MLPGATPEQAAGIAEALRRQVENTVLPHHTPEAARVTASIGAATMVAAPGASPDHLIGAADVRLYQAKCQGRNCIVGG